MPQREKPAPSRAELQATLGIEPSDRNLVGGGQIENFREGWALFIFASPGKRAHWYERAVFDGARALCGVTAPVRWLYGPGNWPRCKRCEKARADTLREAARYCLDWAEAKRRETEEATEESCDG